MVIQMSPMKRKLRWRQDTKLPEMIEEPNENVDILSIQPLPEDSSVPYGES